MTPDRFNVRNSLVKLCMCTLDSEDCVYVRDDVRYVCLHFLLGCHVVTIEMFDSVLIF